MRPALTAFLALAATLAAAAAPLAAQTFSLPAQPGLCVDLGVSIRFEPRRDHVRTLVEVRNHGAGAHAGGRGGAVLAVALGPASAPVQTARFEIGALAAGASRSFDLVHPGTGAFAAWALIEGHAAGASDCNAANNAALRSWGN